jgi:hypothetical protein
MAFIARDLDISRVVRKAPSSISLFGEVCVNAGCQGTSQTPLVSPPPQLKEGKALPSVRKSIMPWLLSYGLTNYVLLVDFLEHGGTLTAACCSTLQWLQEAIRRKRLDYCAVVSSFCTTPGSIPPNLAFG